MGCGFKLHGQSTLPPQMRTLYLKTNNPYGAFETSLKQALISSGVTLADSPHQAPLTLNISKPIQTINNTTTGTSNETRIYNINYSVVYYLTNAQNKVVLPPQTATSTRSLTLSANQLIESNNQLVQLIREMQREVINNMYYRLSSRQVVEQLNRE